VRTGGQALKAQMVCCCSRSEPISKVRLSPDSRRLLLKERVWDLLKTLKSPGQAVNLRQNHLGPRKSGVAGRGKTALVISRLQNEQKAQAAELRSPGESSCTSLGQQGNSCLISRFQGRKREAKVLPTEGAGAPSGHRGRRHYKNRVQLLVRLSDPSPHPPG
jgi:hypothetical protein